MEVIAVIISIVTLIVFFVMAININIAKNHLEDIKLLLRKDIQQRQQANNPTIENKKIEVVKPRKPKEFKL